VREGPDFRCSRRRETPRKVKLYRSRGRSLVASCSPSTVQELSVALHAASELFSWCSHSLPKRGRLKTKDRGDMLLSFGVRLQAPRA
jgi:hypothetical protein